MQEFRRIVKVTDVKKDKEHKKFYIWATNRLFAVQLLYTGALLGMAHIVYRIFRLWILTDIVMYNDIGMLMVVFFYLFWLLPRARLLVSRNKTKTNFGEVYELIINKDGFQVNQHSFSWKRKRIISCKYGIAVLSFWNILLLPVHAFSEEEYNILKTWIK